jgi:hypothetical protein
MIRALFWTGVALVAFLLTAAGVRALIPLPNDYALRDKLEVFREDRDGFDAVYLGSSRAHRAFRPEVIDARLSASGRSFRSYNLGVAGMRDFEIDAMLQRVLAMDPERLRWIVVELPRWERPALTRRNRKTERTLSWHTARQTSLALESIRLADGLSQEERRQETVVHLELAGRRFTSLGRGPLLFEDLTSARSAETIEARASIRATRGYAPVEADRGRNVRDRRERFLENLEEYRATVASAAGRRVGAATSLPRSYNRRALDSQIRSVAESGRRIVYVTVPRPWGDDVAARLDASGLLPDLIDLDRPDLHPELFDPEQRFDDDHLNEEGARLFSELVAAELARRLR